MVAFAAGAARADDAVSLNVESEASYKLGPGDSKLLARKLAVFRAKRKAANQAADRFAKQRFIQFVDRDKNELVALVADQLDAELLQDQCKTIDHVTTCYVRAHTVVRLSDFIDAQLAGLRMEIHEDQESYHDKMKPPAPVPLKPGQALAKAYGLIHKEEWRMAIIYLDQLTHLYPNWGEAYEVKAVALRFENQLGAMQEAWRKACALGRQTACAELK